MSEHPGSRITRHAVVLLVTTCWINAGSTSLKAQPAWLAGYVQTAPLVTGETSIAPGTAANFSRFRVSIEPSAGPISFEGAYEHALTLRGMAITPGFGLGGVQSGGEWLDLQATIADREHAVWHHRFDRLNVGWSPSDTLDVRVGRQAVSWGTTLFLTPADPFTPFIPSDPFRVFRAGVDAARVRLYPGPLSSIDLVVRPTQTTAGNELTVLARGITTWRNWELSGWGGSLYGDAAWAAGAAGSVGAWAVRGEAVVRRVDGTTIGRGTIGVDRAFFLADGRAITIGGEYQRDGLGASAPAAYIDVLRSHEFRRGELQVLGRDEIVANASVQMTPLWTVAGLTLWNLNDASVLISPSLAYSASDEMTVSGGVFLGFGDDVITDSRPLPSEYGVAALTGFVSISWFF